MCIRVHKINIQSEVLIQISSAYSMLNLRFFQLKKEKKPKTLDKVIIDAIS